MKVFSALPHDATESYVPGRCIHRMREAGRRTIAPAVIRRAQMRSTLQNFAGNLDPLDRIVAAFFRTAPWISRHAAGFHLFMGMLRAEPVCGPFPNVADHVDQAVTVRRKTPYRRGPLIAVRAKILPWEFSLPEICHHLTAWRQLIAPGELCLVDAASRSELPFCFRRNFFPSPFCIRAHTTPRELPHDHPFRPASCSIPAAASNRRRGQNSTSCKA